MATGIAQLVETGEAAARVEALGAGVADLLHRYQHPAPRLVRRTAVGTPYKFLESLAHRIDRGLLRRRPLARSRADTARPGERLFEKEQQVEEETQAPYEFTYTHGFGEEEQWGRY
jgi:hypothetical protein